MRVGEKIRKMYADCMPLYAEYAESSLRKRNYANHFHVGDAVFILYPAA